jgi:hypothetical protein
VPEHRSVVHPQARRDAYVPCEGRSGRPRNTVSRRLHRAVCLLAEICSVMNSCEKP